MNAYVSAFLLTVSVAATLGTGWPARADQGVPTLTPETFQARCLAEGNSYFGSGNRFTCGMGLDASIVCIFTMTAANCSGIGVVPAAKLERLTAPPDVPVVAEVVPAPALVPEIALTPEGDSVPLPRPRPLQP
jgi:hypothetical protein